MQVTPWSGRMDAIVVTATSLALLLEFLVGE
jgi:hypothetical protein